MKTVGEFYKEIEGSKELQAELNTAFNEVLEAFLKKNDCAATAQEFVAFAREQTNGEIGDDDLLAVNGGISSSSGSFHLYYF